MSEKKSEGVKVSWYADQHYPLSQAISSGLEFCMISDKREQATPFFLCKDYIQDAIQGRLLHRAQSVYLYNYKPDDKAQPSLTKLRLVVGNNQDQKLGEKVENCRDLLHQVERELQMPRSIICPVQSPPKKFLSSGVFLIIGCQRWLRCPVMVSLYTLLVREGMSHKSGTPFMKTLKGIVGGDINAYQGVDRNYLQRAMPAIEKIIKNGDRKLFGTDTKANYPATITINVMHNYMGIVAYAEGNSRSYMPQWYKE